MIIICFATKFLPPIDFLMVLPFLLEAKDGNISINRGL